MGQYNAQTTFNSTFCCFVVTRSYKFFKTYIKKTCNVILQQTALLKLSCGMLYDHNFNATILH